MHKDNSTEQPAYGSHHQYSLRNIFIIGGITFTLIFCIISATSTINIIKAEKTVAAHSMLENRIFFPLTRAIEEIYTSLADLQAQFTRKHSMATIEQFKWNMESAMESLEQARRAISELLTQNTDITTAVSETKRAAILFQQSGIRALTQTDRLYDSMAQTEQKIDEITEWIHKFFYTISSRPDDINGHAEENYDAVHKQNIALEALSEIRITYLNICADFYRKISLFHTINTTQKDDAQWDKLFSELNNLANTHPVLAGRVMFLQEEIKILRSNMLVVYSAAIAASAAIEKANRLADELGINLELCRQAIAATNMRIQEETNNLRRTMAISLVASIIFYILAATITTYWVRKNVLSPLSSFNAAIRRIADGNDHITLETPALKEISTIAQSFNIMTRRLREREEGLREARRKWETIFKAIGGPAMVLSRELNITEHNQRLNDLILFEDKEQDGNHINIKGRKCYEVVCRDVEHHDSCPVRSMVSGKIKQAVSFEQEIAGKPYLITLSPCLDHAGKVENIVMVAVDLSLQKKLEDQLRRAQKMEALGTLAGGVAHDLNNILAGIVTYPDIMLMQVPEDSPLRKALLTIKKSGLKATAVVQDLLTLARRGVSQRTVINLNDIIREYLESPELKKMLENANNEVKIETRLAPDLMNIEGSHVHISKTVMNLVTNAAEAMPNGGIIRITTANVYVDTPIPGYDKVTEGDYVLLTIKDNGTGISKEDMPHIFEPFYTRKVMGRSGSGLGMAVVWGSVKDHFGYIDIESTVGEGTTVKVYLPVTRQEKTEQRRDTEIQKLRGSETILVVDDVKEQQEVAQYLLETLGYDVDTASCGEEAVEMCSRKRYDLIVLDMIMPPGIDGYETYRRIKEINPEQKAVIASGFSETERVSMAQELGAGAYIKKPYTMEKLARAVRYELDA